MKKAILFIGVLFFMLMTMPSYAQNTSKEQKESKTKTEGLQKKRSEEKKMLVMDPYKKNKHSSSKNPATKVEEKGVSTPDHNHATTEERGLDVPDFMKNPKSKNRIARVPQKLEFENSSFQIKLSDNGFDLYENGSSTVYAKLVPSEKEGHYFYSSSTKNGTAHFDAKGNLIMKYLNNDTGEMKEIYFQSN